ncbi:putative isrso12 transposase orf a (fragment) protein [Xanthomonas albilineans GPE PC73]|uniref:Putative isrso12 transposase orf a protein n=2 Tax=Xanthomonas albilineans TaxID=29447 RepID=D2UEJ2_XANAP
MGPRHHEESNDEEVTFYWRTDCLRAQAGRAGGAVGEICRMMGIAVATFYVWRKKYGWLGLSELKRLWLLEEENRKLKQRVADLSMDKAMLQEMVTEKL